MMAIYINTHLENNKLYKSHQDAYPKLFYTDFNGKSRQIKHIDICVKDDGVYVQTDLNDVSLIRNEVKNKLNEMLINAEQRIKHDAEIANVIRAVL